MRDGAVGRFIGASSVPAAFVAAGPVPLVDTFVFPVLVVAVAGTTLDLTSSPVICADRRVAVGRVGGAADTVEVLPVVEALAAAGPAAPLDGICLFAGATACFLLSGAISAVALRLWVAAVAPDFEAGALGGFRAGTSGFRDAPGRGCRS